jgi:hypothetical protein
MIKCVAIYPDYITEEYIRRVEESVRRASKHHFDEIFTTVHLPEYTIEEQMKGIALIAKEAKKYYLDITVDVGGECIEQILNDSEKLAFFKKIPIDFIRLDYGYDENQVKSLYEQLNIRGIVLNASIYSQKEVDKIMTFFQSISENIEIRACHNFYIREESGIDSEYALRQDSFLKKYEIPIYYCIPSYANPRGPLHMGLCTLEKHRNKRIRNILSDLYLNYNLTAFMLADEWISEDEYEEVEKTIEVLTATLSKEVAIDIQFLENVTKKEKEIVLGTHIFRNDSPEQFLRSQSSRQMAEIGSLIEKNHTVLREEGMITIDNKLNKRYSGELQVITRRACRSEKVNVVAKLIHPYDLLKLLRFREGISYRFCEVDK